MRIVALLSWFDENPGWLRRTVESLPKMGVDHLIALDGAYDLFPKAKPRSPSDQHDALFDTATNTGIRLDIVMPDTTWPTEMAKRQRLFDLAERATTDTDWYFVVDADEAVLEAPTNLKQVLAHSYCDVAEAVYEEPQSNGLVARFPRRCLFRAQRGIHLGTNHYTYLTADGRKLWGEAADCVPAHRVEKLLLEHRTYLRPKQRQLQAKRYYDIRNQLKVEVGPCDWCGQPGEVEIPSGWTLQPEGLKAERWTSACKHCEGKVRAENDRVLRAHGLVPELAQVTYHKAAV